MALGAQHAVPLQRRHSNRLGSGGAGDAVFEKGDELCRVAGWGEAGLAGAYDGKGFASGERGEGLFEGAGQMELRGFGGDAEYGLA